MYMADLLPGLLIVKAYNQTQRQLSEINKNGKLFSQATLKVLRIAFISAFYVRIYFYIKYSYYRCEYWF